MSRPSSVAGRRPRLCLPGHPGAALHYPLPHHRGIQPVTDDGQLTHPAVGTGCSCRDPSCGQPAKHPLGALVPHGLKTRRPIGPRCWPGGPNNPRPTSACLCHLFDVLDVDSPFGAQAMRTSPAPAPPQLGPLVPDRWRRWHYYLAPTGLGNVGPRDLEQVDWRGRGGYRRPPSRHRSGHYQWVAGRDLDTALPDVPAALLSGCSIARPTDLPRSSPSRVGDRPGPGYGQAALAQELARVAGAPTVAATSGCGKPPATSTTWSPPAPSTTSRSTTACPGRRTLRPAG